MQVHQLYGTQSIHFWFNAVLGYISMAVQVNEVYLAVFPDINITKSHEILYSNQGFKMGNPYLMEYFWSSHLRFNGYCPSDLHIYKSECVNYSVMSNSSWSHELSPPMEFSRQEYWSGLPCPSPGYLSTQGSNPGLLHCSQILYCLSQQKTLKYFPMSLNKSRN